MLFRSPLLLQGPWPLVLYRWAAAEAAAGMPPRPLPASRPRVVRLLAAAKVPAGPTAAMLNLHRDPPERPEPGESPVRALQEAPVLLRQQGPAQLVPGRGRGRRRLQVRPVSLSPSARR